MSLSTGNQPRQFHLIQRWANISESPIGRTDVSSVGTGEPIDPDRSGKISQI